ncbi:MAG TPA: metal ABC transporter substrate-binding protein [Spirochaetota bacterium]|nr:metal ABC transporter substrate-binding protein [Spirochaetota bacterium]HOH38329.1 metal ABC transporter substrate-binding protein [Spirochaetota bacterium]HPW50986.1 metal ABC transporter substrate-binding protein [Spirochaetota bacterium]
MKKIILLPLILAVCAFSACKKNSNATETGFTVVTSFYPIYIIAKNVAAEADGVKVINMTPPITGCLHDYSITAGDMKLIEKADLFLMNGAGMENFSDEIASRYPKLNIRTLDKGVEIFDENPHIWLSLDNMAKMVSNCEAALSEADSSNSALYKKNAEEYITEIKTLQKEMHSDLAKYKGKQIVTFHEAFPYFAKEFSFKIASVIEREPGSEPSAKELAETVKIIRNSKVRSIFAEPQYPKSAAETIAKETGVNLFVLDPAVTGPDDNKAYINIMKQNLAVLKKAFD